MDAPVRQFFESTKMITVPNTFRLLRGSCNPMCAASCSPQFLMPPLADLSSTGAGQRTIKISFFQEHKRFDIKDLRRFSAGFRGQTVRTRVWTAPGDYS